MVNLLIARSLFQVVWFGRASPHDVPLGTVGTDDAAASTFESVYD